MSVKITKAVIVSPNQAEVKMAQTIIDDLAEINLDHLPEVVAAVKQAKKASQEICNGIRKPFSNTTSGKIWELADKLTAKLKKPVTPLELVAEGDKQGFNHNNMLSEHSLWKRFHGYIIPRQRHATAPALNHSTYNGPFRGNSTDNGVPKANSAPTSPAQSNETKVAAATAPAKKRAAAKTQDKASVKGETN